MDGFEFGQSERFGLGGAEKALFELFCSNRSFFGLTEGSQACQV